jgi:hypothetical protein
MVDKRRSITLEWILLYRIDCFLFHGLISTRIEHALVDEPCVMGRGVKVVVGRALG